jgi:ribosomal protection tetracycline resistance protein
MEVDHAGVPQYVYKNLATFTEHMDQYVREALQEGLFGWQVTDCVVTMTRCSYSIADGPPSRRGPPSTAADFRKLTPLVLMQALVRAGSVVCEPTARVSLEIPAGTTGAVVSALARSGAAMQTSSTRGQLSRIETVLPVARAQDLKRQLPGLTGGEGVLESSFDGYEPVSTDPPTRPRTTADPLNLDEYMMRVGR